MCRGSAHTVHEVARCTTLRKLQVFEIYACLPFFQSECSSVPQLGVLPRTIEAGLAPLVCRDFHALLPYRQGLTVLQYSRVWDQGPGPPTWIPKFRSSFRGVGGRISKLRLLPQYRPH
jgi:hypothetical protein